MFIKSLGVGEYQVNCFIVGCENHLRGIVIDPGEDADEIIQRIEQSKIIVDYIICTHAHFDHIGAVSDLKKKTGAKFLLHKNDLPILNSAMNKDMLEYMGLPTPPPPDIFAEDNVEFKICDDLKFKIIHTPGHTPGGLSVVMEKHIFTGDTLFADSIGRTDFPLSSHEDIMKSIKEKLFLLSDDHIVHPGHGPDSDIASEKKTNPFLK